MNPYVRELLHKRLRRPPGRFTVPGSLPVLFFGNISTARVATVAINPSDREYLAKSGMELDGPSRRFETLTSLAAQDRASLSAEQCDRAIHTMLGYFGPGKPVYDWFQPLSLVLGSMGFCFDRGEAVHLDLVQEATRPKWSELNKTSPADAETMLRADESFLRWQIEAFPLAVIVCNGRTPLDAVQRLLGSRSHHQGTLNGVTWSVGVATLDRPVVVAGWNLALAYLGTAVQIELGRVLKAHIGRLPVSLSTGPPSANQAQAPSKKEHENT